MSNDYREIKIPMGLESQHLAQGLTLVSAQARHVCSDKHVFCAGDMVEIVNYYESIVNRARNLSPVEQEHAEFVSFLTEQGVIVNPRQEDSLIDLWKAHCLLAPKSDAPVTKQSKYGLDNLYFDPASGKHGYVTGFDMDDGCCGYMTVTDADDHTGEIVSVDTTMLVPSSHVAPVIPSPVPAFDDNSVQGGAIFQHIETGTHVVIHHVDDAEEATIINFAHIGNGLKSSRKLYNFRKEFTLNIRAPKSDEPTPAAPAAPAAALPVPSGVEFCDKAISSMWVTLNKMLEHVNMPHDTACIEHVSRHSVMSRYELIINALGQVDNWCNGQIIAKPQPISIPVHQINSLLVSNGYASNSTSKGDLLQALSNAVMTRHWKESAERIVEVTSQLHLLLSTDPHFKGEFAVNGCDSATTISEAIRHITNLTLSHQLANEYQVEVLELMRRYDLRNSDYDEACTVTLNDIIVEYGQDQRAAGQVSSQETIGSEWSKVYRTVFETIADHDCAVSEADSFTSTFNAK